VVLVVSAGAVFSLVIFLVLRWGTGRAVERAFRLAARERASAVQHTFDVEVGMMELARAAMMGDGKIERDEFQQMMSPFLARSPSIYAVEWAPRVRFSQRAEFEAAGCRGGLAGFRITEEDAVGRMVTAAEREEYFPVFFIGPKPKDPAIFGYDVASEPTRRGSIRLACDLNKTVASGRIRFVHDEASSGGFLVCLPVYEKDQPVGTVADRRRHFMGCLLGVFRLADMIESSIAALQPEGIDVGLYDASEAAGRIFDVHASRTRAEGDGSAEARELLQRSADRYTARLDVAGRPWTVVCAPTAEFEAAHRTWWPSAVLTAGLLLTALAAGSLWSSIRHAGQLEAKVREQTADIRAAQEEVICRLVTASQWCDDETAMHVRRVGALSQALAVGADWMGNDAEAIRQAASMHDVGKIGVPDAVLQKPGKLTAEEFEIMKTHTVIGADIFAGSKVPMLQMARDIAFCHHERWDGKGYPRGLAGTEIPESARIVAIVDVFDALTHDRVYRPAMSEEEALAILRAGSETQFDPALLATFFRRLPEMRALCQQNADPARPGRRGDGERGRRGEGQTARQGDKGISLPAVSGSSPCPPVPTAYP
jgi:HD-GYP domain-containing protein (c-di-GMP phosphodiesterase class II)